MTDRRVNKTHSHKERGLDCYWTPREATRALMSVERLPRIIIDPCCGSGAILSVLAEEGHLVHGIDVADYEWRERRTLIRDYLTAPVAICNAGIVTNPPFRLAEKFVRKAISDGCQYHAWLLRTNFLEGLNRMPFWREHPFSRMWVASLRLPMMHRLNYVGPEFSSNQSFSWFVWDNASPDKRLVNWFNWRDV